MCACHRGSGKTSRGRNKMINKKWDGVEIHSLPEKWRLDEGEYFRSATAIQLFEPSTFKIYFFAHEKLWKDDIVDISYTKGDEITYIEFKRTKKPPAIKCAWIKNKNKIGKNIVGNLGPPNGVFGICDNSNNTIEEWYIWL